MELSSSNIKKFLAFSYIPGNENTEKISYILSKESFSNCSAHRTPHPPPTPQKILIFQETELPYNSGRKWKP